MLIVEPGAFRTAFGGTHALRHMPVNAAYRDALADIRGVVHAMDGAQPDDPAKAAHVVCRRWKRK